MNDVARRGGRPAESIVGRAARDQDAFAADAVSSCPPLFQPSHHGCLFRPSTTEMVVLGGVFFLGVVIFVAAVLGRKKDDER